MSLYKRLKFLFPPSILQGVSLKHLMERLNLLNL